MAAVLGLIPDPLTRAVEHLGADLLTGMRGQVVHRKGVRQRKVEQRVIEAVGGKCSSARSGLGLIPIEIQTSV